MEPKAHKLTKAEELLQDQNQLLLQVFANPPGRKFLKILCMLFYDVPVFNPDTHTMAFKEGQRDVVGYIKEQLEIAEENIDG